jgi:hypothetical protein
VIRKFTNRFLKSKLGPLSHGQDFCALEKHAGAQTAPATNQLIFKALSKERIAGGNNPGTNVPESAF